jgi:hypothetical protein
LVHLNGDQFRRPRRTTSCVPIPDFQEGAGDTVIAAVLFQAKIETAA